MAQTTRRVVKAVVLFGVMNMVRFTVTYTLIYGVPDFALYMWSSGIPLFFETCKSMTWSQLKGMSWNFLHVYGFYMSFRIFLNFNKFLDNFAKSLNNQNPSVKQASNVTVRFGDVLGVDEAKSELEEIVEYLRNPGKFTRLGGKLPKGLLLLGAPGTGKTLLAKAIAGEAGVPFFYTSGSEFDEMYVGVGSRRVRDLFAAAATKSPCIVFIDEIDAIGGAKKLSAHSDSKATLNELLVQMDGFTSNSGVLVIGATNSKDRLDAALIRPGRFDKHVVVPLPDVKGRKQILELYGGRTVLADGDGDSADWSVLARGTPGMSGAELCNLVNQAAIKAAMDGSEGVTHSVLEWAKDKILMGSERQSAVVTPETAKCTAYHEGGHALVGLMTPGSDPIHKATIMPRGTSLGMVMQLPEGDQNTMSKKQMLATLDVCMGGRVAEGLVFGDDNITTGACSDIQQASRLARAMVTKYGFSDEIGVVFHDGELGENAAEETRQRIDKEVKKLCDESYQRATDLLRKYHKEHKSLSEALLEFETLTGKEIDDLVHKNIRPKRVVENTRGGAKGDTSILSGGSS
jgi:ATP-dependent metalloprotease